MIFRCEDETYLASEMTAHATGNPQMPMVYVTEDYSKVFAVTMNRWTGTHVRRCDFLEIEALANRYDLPDLRRALPSGGLAH